MRNGDVGRAPPRSETRFAGFDMHGFVGKCQAAGVTGKRHRSPSDRS